MIWLASVELPWNMTEAHREVPAGSSPDLLHQPAPEKIRMFRCWFWYSGVEYVVNSQRCVARLRRKLSKIRIQDMSEFRPWKSVPGAPFSRGPGFWTQQKWRIWSSETVSLVGWAHSYTPLHWLKESMSLLSFWCDFLCRTYWLSGDVESVRRWGMLATSFSLGKVELFSFDESYLWSDFLSERPMETTGKTNTDSYIVDASEIPNNNHRLDGAKKNL